MASKADELKRKKQEADEQLEKVKAELARETTLGDPENGGNLAHYSVSFGKVDIYGPSDKEQVTMTEANFRKLLVWGNNLFGE